MLEDVKLALRISHNAFDSEIEDLISAARVDLIISGVSETIVKKEEEADALVKRAIITYVKANFGWDNPDYEKFNKSYELIKMHLTMSGDHNAIS